MAKYNTFYIFKNQILYKTQNTIVIGFSESEPALNGYVLPLDRKFCSIKDKGGTFTYNFYDNWQHTIYKNEKINGQYIQTDSKTLSCNEFKRIFGPMDKDIRNYFNRQEKAKAMLEKED